MREKSRSKDQQTKLSTSLASSEMQNFRKKRANVLPLITPCRSQTEAFTAAYRTIQDLFP